VGEDFDLCGHCYDRGLAVALDSAVQPTLGTSEDHTQDLKCPICEPMCRHCSALLQVDLPLREYHFLCQGCFVTRSGLFSPDYESADDSVQDSEGDDPNRGETP
jgi:hypothetical protein